MKLSEAIANPNAGVIYTPGHGDKEDGTIVEVRGSYVMVSYAGRVKATMPEDLTFLTPPHPLKRWCPACFAQPNEPCTQPDDRGRHPVRTFHLSREAR